MKLAQDFRRQAKEALRGKWFIALIAGIIASLLGGLNGMGSAGVNFGGSSSSEGGSGTVVPPAGGGDVNVSDEMLEILGIFFIILGVVAVVAVIMSIVYLIIGGAVGIGIESTIIDLTEEIPMVLRPGYITPEMLTM